MGLKLLLLLLSAALLAGCSALVDRRAAEREAEAERAFPPLGQMVEVEDLRLHAVVRGKGPDVVLIHGLSGNLRDFTFSMVDRLAERYRVIAFDRPGLGYSDPLPAEANGLTDQARVLSKAAAALGAKRPLVLGQSYGGAVALAWAATRPDSYSGLVLVSAVSQTWPDGLPLFYRVTSSRLGSQFAVPLISAFVSEATVNAAVAEVFEPQVAPPGYAAHIGAGLTLRRQTMRANADQRADLKPEVEALRRLYPGIRRPVEIIHGTADPIVPHDVHAIPLSQQIPGAALTLLPGIGHMPHQVAQDAVIEALDRAARRALPR
ncbi:alpha/beta hydrolase [Brevirhabdus pacifica]|uniref:Alpha/beta hydrolase n=1 Tax=Brevirhabdus pacifica TaxID=1267768 RepID=A0A1U7DF25_9RHOB|nr:alpha/beta hydrolase [Brevirhabdus pacifica]APX88561.1 alpha/beta hydrolase [Brevirhabdus pacifica]OWU79852.1 alpha/beta hydrolase [Loktanella sp. 22II-4b]PJJ86951.1 pimeloyl-ACP methyl ester carboxylesterase [Brevirhabdus pacifica]